MNVGKFSVTNPVLINIVMIAILVMGTVSLLRLPREAMSDVAFSWVFIAVPYPGASAEEVEKNVTIKIEDEVSDVDRIKTIASTTRQGLCFVQVSFEDEISKRDFLRLYQDVRTEFDKVDLPEGTLDPMIDDFSSSDFMPIITVNIKGDVPADQINRAARDLQDELLDIDGVSKAEIVGGQDREVWVEANREKMDAFGISIDEITNAIRSRNLTIPGGNVDIGTRSYVLQTLGEISKAKDFGKVIVRRRPGQGSIRVDDLASINKGLAESDYDVRYDGEQAISLMVSKKLRANTIELVDQLRITVDEYQKTLPEGLSVHLFNDTSVFIRDIIDVLTRNAVVGFVVLVLVLFVFIGFKNSLLTALGIPMTFAITLIFMEATGESLNGNSLFALVMVLGMIVDHAIVIMENSYRHRQSGLSSAEAAIRGTNEVVKPVIAGTLTTVAAFLPLMLLPGIMGKFMRVIPIVTSLALVASTVEALFILPSHFAEWGSKPKSTETGFISRWQGAFGNFISTVYRHRYLTMIVTAVIVIVSMAATPFIKQNLFAGEEFPQAFVDIRLPEGSPRHMTNTVTARFEERLLPLIGNGEIKSLTATVGFLTTDDEWLTQSNVAQITVEMNQRNEGRDRPILVIMEDLQDLCSDIPGAEEVKFRMMSNGPPLDKPVTFRLLGENFDDLASVADEYVRQLGSHEELYNISHNYDAGSPELQVHVNEERATELGLSVAQIGMYIRNCFDGITATTFFEGDEEVDVVVKLAEEYRQSMADIMQMNFPTMDGRLIPFSTVCSMERGRGISTIKRTDQRRAITVSADATDKRNLKTITKEIKSTFDQKYQAAYPAMSLKMGGEFAEFGKMVSDILRLLGVGLFLMYVILGAQFKSFFQPFLMISSIFFAAVGCILFLVISQTPMSVVVMFAAVALVGICVNDSIVLISFINSQKRSGLNTRDAIVKGAVVRLRPIILTSVTTIAGLLPMAIGLGGRSDTWAPMASTIMFGLLFSTIGTLVVIPCAYAILDDITTRLGGKMKLEGE